MPEFDGTVSESKGSATGRGIGLPGQKKSSQFQLNKKEDSWIDTKLRNIRMIRKK